MDWHDFGSRRLIAVLALHLALQGLLHVNHLRKEASEALIHVDRIEQLVVELQGAWLCVKRHFEVKLDGVLLVRPQQLFDQVLLILLSFVLGFVRDVPEDGKSGPLHLVLVPDRKLDVLNVARPSVDERRWLFLSRHRLLELLPTLLLTNAQLHHLIATCKGMPALSRSH